MINALRGNILEALATYRYLVPTQLMKVGVGTTQLDYLRKNLRWLRDRGRPFVGCYKFNSPDPKKGSVEYMYFLKPRGAVVCVEHLGWEEGNIRMPKGRGVAYKDYHHRKQTVDFYIKLQQWVEQGEHSVLLLDAYFDKVGNNRIAKNMRSKNRIPLSDDKYLIPDLNVILELNDGSKEILLYELHRGNDSGRIIDQIYKHAEAQYLGSTQTMYNLLQPYQVLILFDHEGCMEATIRNVVNSHPRLAPVREYFLCKTLDQLEELPFTDGWKSLSGNIVRLFE